MPRAEVLRYSAFPATPTGGNPAGVVLDATGLDAAEMLDIAAEVGFSETAFLTSTAEGAGIRYFSPRAEVAFCGHATIATAVAHADRHGVGRLDLATQAGPVPVVTTREDDQILATLTSVAPSIQELSGPILDRTLAALGWPAGDLDDTLPPAGAFAGNHHPVIAASTRARLAALDYDYDALDQIMAEHEWTTMQLVFRERDDVFHARDPFPPGGVVEDPATGAAAAALGGYLRAFGLVPQSRRVSVHQGYDMGRPSLLRVDIPVGDGGISVGGTATRLSG